MYLLTSLLAAAAPGKRRVSMPGVERVRTDGLFEHPASYEDSVRALFSCVVDEARILF
jgi:hypothetical protein